MTPYTIETTTGDVAALGTLFFKLDTSTTTERAAVLEEIAEAARALIRVERTAFLVTTYEQCPDDALASLQHAMIPPDDGKSDRRAA